MMNVLFPVCVFNLALMAQAQSESLVAAQACDLEPVESALTYHTPAYYPNLRKALFSKVIGSVKFQFLLLPSFSPECLLSVNEDSEGHFYGQTLFPEKQIWDFNGDVTNITVSGKTKMLPQSLARRANGVWESMLVRTRYQGRYTILDGVGYVFLCRIKIKNGYEPTLTGESSNPEEGTRPNVLADIGGCLIRYVNCTKEEEPSVEHKILELLSQLETALREPKGANQAAKAIRAPGAK